MGHFEKPYNFKLMCGRLWGDSFLCALDPGNAVYDLLRRGRDHAAIVVFDSEGKMVHCGTNPASANRYYPSIPGKPRVITQDLKEAFADYLDDSPLHGLRIPTAADTAVKMINKAQYGMAMKLLERLPDSGETGEFRSEILKRLEKIKDNKLAFMENLEQQGNKWGAYKVGMSFLRTFPAAGEASRIKMKLRSLRRDSEVKKEAEAQEMFLKLISMCCGSKSKAAARSQARTAFSQLAGRFEGTEYGELAKLMAR